MASVNPPINKIRQPGGGTKKNPGARGGIGWGDEIIQNPIKRSILAEICLICHGGIINLPFGGTKNSPAPPGGCLGDWKTNSRFEKVGGLR